MNEPGKKHSRARQPAAEAGWTVVELTVAGSLLLVGLLAVAPLFVRAVRDVAYGKQRSNAAGMGQDRLEAVTTVVYEPDRVAGPEYFSLEHRSWCSEPPSSPDRALWTRQTTLSLFTLEALADGVLEAAESIGTDSGSETDIGVLMSVEVEVAGGPANQMAVALQRLGGTRG